MSTGAGCCGFAVDHSSALKVFQADGRIQLDLPTHTFEFLYKSGDFLVDALFLA